MSVSCDWLHFCFFACVLKRRVVKTTVIQPLVAPDLYNKKNNISASQTYQNDMPCACLFIYKALWV